MCPRLLLLSWQANYQSIREQNPGIAAKEVFGKLGQAWKSLSDTQKAEYAVKK